MKGGSKSPSACWLAHSKEAAGGAARRRIQPVGGSDGGGNGDDATSVFTEASTIRQTLHLFNTSIKRRKGVHGRRDEGYQHRKGYRLVRLRN
jgi:GTPase involved in cell partitioning and DNA repair